MNCGTNFLNTLYMTPRAAVYHHVNNKLYNSFVCGLISIMENYTQFSLQSLIVSLVYYSKKVTKPLYDLQNTTLVTKISTYKILFPLCHFCFTCPKMLYGFYYRTWLRVPEDLTNVLMSSHCVFEYDGIPYQRLILGVDDNMVEISAVHRIGVKRFFWYRPNMTSLFTVDVQH